MTTKDMENALYDEIAKAETERREANELHDCGPEEDAHLHGVIVGLKIALRLLTPHTDNIPEELAQAAIDALTNAGFRLYPQETP